METQVIYWKGLLPGWETSISESVKNQSFSSARHKKVPVTTKAKQTGKSMHGLSK